MLQFCYLFVGSTRTDPAACSLLACLSFAHHIRMAHRTVLNLASHIPSHTPSPPHFPIPVPAGVDEHTGEVLNKAAALAYEQFVFHGVNYSDAYKHYAAWFEEHGDADTSPDSVLSGTATGGGSAAAAAAAAGETPIAAPRAARKSAHYTAAADLRRSGRGWRSKAKRGLLLPTKDAPPPPRRLIIGAGVLKGTVVDREAVQLRKVERIRGDRAFRGNAADFSFEAVKGRREVVTPTPRSAALAQQAAAASSTSAGGGSYGYYAADGSGDGAAAAPASAFSPGFHA